MLVRDRRGRKLAHATEFEAALGVPVLGMLPAPTSSCGAARAVACANLVARPELEADLRGSLLMVVSCGRRTAAGEVAADLAGQFAQAHRVLLVQADLNGQPCSEPPFSPGLTTLLSGEELLRRAVGELHIVPQPVGNGPPDPDSVVSYSVISSGPRVDDAATLLQRPALARLLTKARAPFDVVVVDCGSLLPAGDTASLAHMCDEILLVAEGRRTTRADVDDVRRALGALYEKVIGVAVQAPRRRGRRLVALLAARSLTRPESG